MNPNGSLANFAFQIPRTIAVNAISVSFTTTAALALVETTVTVTAQLYKAAEGSNEFWPIDETRINLTPSLSGTVAIGTVLKGANRNLSTLVMQEAKLMLVFSATASGVSPISTVTGYASAGMIFT